MKEWFRLKNVEIHDTHFGYFEPIEKGSRYGAPRLKVRVNFCIVDETGFESATGWQQKYCYTWTDVKDFISGYCDKEEAENLVNAYAHYFKDRIIRFNKLHEDMKQ